MAQLCFCFSDAPPDRSKPNKNKKEALYDKFYDYSNTFQITMCEAITAGQPCCCLSSMPCFLPCASCYMRDLALKQVGNGMADYICGQGYLPACCCWRPGQMGEKTCPHFCLCCEAVCCPGLAVSATRMLTMDAYQLQPDPCDNKIIAFNNCIQVLSCICHIMAMIDSTFSELAAIIDCIADLVFLSTAGCMTAQVNKELEYQKNNMSGGMVAGAPQDAEKAVGAPAEAEEMAR